MSNLTLNKFLSSKGSQTNFSTFPPVTKVSTTTIISTQEKRKLNPTPLKKKLSKFLFYKNTACIYIHIYTYLGQQWSQQLAAITEIWKLTDGWNISIFQICSCPVKHLKCFSPVKSSAKMHLKPHISIGHANCYRNYI